MGFSSGLTTITKKGESKMGICEGCNKTFNAWQMEDGLCGECYEKKNGITIDQSLTQQNKMKPPKSKKILKGIGAITLIGIGYYIYTDITYPSDAIVKNIASQMINHPEDKIEIVSSYKANGGVMMNLKVGQAICEMPMLNTDSDGWVGHGINCQGNLDE